jgi:branched-chain amino acid transport system permease protein
VSTTKVTRAAAMGGGAVLVWLLADHVLSRGAPLGIVVLGLVYGALYALSAIGLVLVYRANRVINFAQAELGALAGVVTVWLGLLRGAPYVVAVLAGLVLATVTGALVHYLIIRRLERAPRLIVAVATIAIAQILNGASILLALHLSHGLRSGTLSSPYNVHFGLAPVTFNGDHLVAMVAVPLVVAALTLFLRRGDYGVGIRAAADSGDRARLLGVPVGRLATVVWSLAGALSGLAVILRVPITGFISFSSISAGGPALLVRTLAAAVIARMEDFRVAALAALAIGVVEALTTWTTGSATYVDAVLVLVILGALLAQRGRFSRRDESALATSRFQAIREVRPIPEELRDLPEVRYGLAALRVVLLAFALSLPLWLPPSRLQLAAVILIYGLVGVSLVVLTGWAGQISLGHWALVGVGGTVAATLYGRHGWDFFLAAPAGVLVAAAVALVIGLPALRIRGPFLAVTTLAFALTSSSYLLQARHFPWLVTTDVARPTLWGRLALDRDWERYLLCLVVFILALSAVAALRRSRTGRALIALRDNEPAAAAVAIAPTRLKLTAFVISGALAGMAGVLYVVVHQSGLRTDAFGPEVGLRIFSMVVIGGLGSLTGAVLGAAYIRGAEFFLPAGWSAIASGAGVLALLLLVPGGLGELLYRGRDRLLRLIAARRSVVVPSLIADIGVDTPEPVAPSTDDAPALLRVRGLDAGYDRVQVLFGVDFTVHEGEVVALLGTNGAGKSTLLRAISGLLTPSGGTVTFDGADITGMTAERVAALGLAQVPGGRGVFASLTVEDNLRVAGWLRRGDPAGLARATEKVLELFPVLRQRWQTPAGDLSGGEQQMLSLGQAFVTRPRLLLIDELSLGLAPTIVDQLLEIVTAMRSDGVTIVLVEQSVTTAFRVAERAVFMEKGQPRYEGPIAELLDRPDIVRAVFLQAPRSRSKPSARAAGAPVLTASELTKSYGGVAAVSDVSFQLGDGEILGVIGPNGAGKTTLFDLVTGFQAPSSGAIQLGDGTDVVGWSAPRRAFAGFGRSFQDARLWPSLTVREVLAVACERQVDVPGAVSALFGLPAVRDSEAAVDQRVDELVELLGLTAYRDKFAGELSTGTRRIVELGTLLAHRPSIVLLDEPSSGIAQRETEALGPMLTDVRAQLDCSMIVIEHDMALITSLADRLMAMVSGQVVTEGSARQVLDHPLVVEAYLGKDAVRR